VRMADKLSADIVRPRSGDDVIDSQERARRGITTGRAARIAWHRARGLSMVSRVRGLGAVITPWLWPMHLAVAAAQNDQIRYRGSASMAVDDGDRYPIHRPAMALGPPRYSSSSPSW
jgi:hypothetical protein